MYAPVLKQCEIRAHRRGCGALSGGKSLLTTGTCNTCPLKGVKLAVIHCPPTIHLLALQWVLRRNQGFLAQE